jgi:ferredoxin
MTYVAVVDPDECAAHGDCVELAPDVFVLGAVAEVVGTAPPEQLVAAAEACPSVAISVLDDVTGERLF